MKNTMLGGIVGLVTGYILAFLITIPLALFVVPFLLSYSISLDQADLITNIFQVLIWLAAIIVGAVYGHRLGKKKESSPKK